MSGLLIAVIILIGSQFNYGCFNSSNSPKVILWKYLDASLHGREREAYQYVSESDKFNRPDYIPKETINDTSSFRQVLNSNISFNITNFKVDDDTAYGDVSITVPNFEILFRDVHAAAFGSIYQETIDKKDLDTIMANRYKDKDIPTDTSVKQYSLEKENGKWKVKLGWKADKWDIDLVQDYFNIDNAE